MQDFLAITKALSDENRVRALIALSSGELCVCQIIELLRLAPSTVSKHISILKQARLVESDRNGKWVYYRLPSETSRVAAEAIEWAKRHLISESTVKKDALTLKAIIKQHPVEVCKKQKQSRVAKVLEAASATVKARP